MRVGLDGEGTSFGELSVPTQLHVNRSRNRRCETRNASRTSSRSTAAAPSRDCRRPLLRGIIADIPSQWMLQTLPSEGTSEGDDTMRRYSQTSVVLAVALLIGPASGIRGDSDRDTDRDGLSDQTETDLGTDPGFAEPLAVLGTYSKGTDKSPELDLLRVEFANVAHDRWLWAMHFAQPYRFDNSGLIVYVDADNDPATGRRQMGCELMLSHDRGRPGVTAFAPDGADAPAPLPRVALVGGVLYICHDGELKQEDGHSTFRFTVLSETRDPHASVDSSGWTGAIGPANSDRPKAVVLDDLSAAEGFECTEGLDLVWQLQNDPGNVVISSVGADLQNMTYHDTEYRWPAVRGAQGAIVATVPKAGRFHPALVVYDTAGRETYEMLVDGNRVGRFLAAEDDRRQRVHFLSQPIEFRGGEKLTIRTGTVGSHITEDILLLADRPPVRARRYELRQIEWGLAKNVVPPQVRVTWITTWPVACRVEFGPTTAYGKQLTEEEPTANHRLLLTGLQQGEQLHFRIVATRPDGAAVASPDVTAVCAPRSIAGSAERERLTLTVENPYEFALADFPVTNGVPFAQGELADEKHVRLVDGQGRPVPVQSQVAVRWQDGSVKWLRISFLATVAADSPAKYTLEYGTRLAVPPRERSSEVSAAESRHATAALSVSSVTDKSFSITTGPLRACFDAARSGFPTRIQLDANGDRQWDETDPCWDGIVSEVTDATRQQHLTQGPVEHIEVEEAGPVRIVVKVTGHHQGPAGTRLFAYENRFSFYAGWPLVRVQYTWGNDRDAAFTDLERITLRIPLAPARREWSVGLGGGKVLTGAGDLSLRQLRDTECSILPAMPADGATVSPQHNTSSLPQRADGWLDVTDHRAGLTVTVRDFWQLYPKGFSLDAANLLVDLCPDFPDGTYDDCTRLDEIKLYYYLMNGKYKVARGVQKQHEILLYFRNTMGANRSDSSDQVDEPSRHVNVARAFQEPLVAACSPERYCDTRVFGDILPATAGRSPEYEAVCERVYQNYVHHREESHEYGMLNYGDQWGERRVNWANGEYDHHHAFLMQFVRTADRRWYCLGERAARHAIDVDTCHFGPRRGGEWIHSMGHTGGYFREQYEGSGIPDPGMSVSHTWTEGFSDWYVLSGDPTAAENAALVADYYGGTYLNNYDWDNCRTNGWHLLLTVATYRATNDPFYLNAARIIVERTLERQTPSGGWHRQMVPGHCHDLPRHRGEANFMLGVLANGLEEYYREVPDPRVAAAILGGAKQAVDELWVPECDGFRYTSCPNMTGYTANNDMTAEILFFAHRLGADSQYADIALRAMRAAFRDGIGSVAHLRWTPHIVFNIDQLQRERGAP
jgi:hypothetical protein